MLRAVSKRRRDRFDAWRHAPVRNRDRVRGAAVGGIGGFWIVLLGWQVFGPQPISVELLGF